MSAQPALTPEHLKELRDFFAIVMAARPYPKDVTTAASMLAGVPALEIRGGAVAEDAVILWLHGGAYVAGAPEHTIALTAAVSRAVGCRAVAIDYRLAPESPFPAALDDALAAYRALLDAGIPADRIVVVGESAGGGLAISTLVAARIAGLGMPAAIAVMSPWSDLTLSSTTMTSRLATDAALSPQALAGPASGYLAGAGPEDPLASPLFADLRGLPPLLVHVGSHEVLLDDSVALAARAADADVEVELHVYPGMQHVFQSDGPDSAEAGRSVARIGDFLAARLGLRP